MNELFICLFSEAIMMKHNLVIFNVDIIYQLYNGFPAGYDAPSMGCFADHLWLEIWSFQQDEQLDY